MEIIVVPNKLISAHAKLLLNLPEVSQQSFSPGVYYLLVHLKKPLWTFIQSKLSVSLLK